MNTASHTSPSHPPAAPVRPSRERMFNVPPVTLVLAVILVSIHIWRNYFLSQDEDMTVIIRLGFLPLNLHDYAFQSIWPWISLVSYALLHFGWTHLIVNVTGILAFGAGVERNFGIARYLIVLVLGIIAGALVHYIFFPDDVVVLGGISAGLSTLFAVIIGMIQQRNGWKGIIIPSLVWIVMNIVIGFIGIPGEAAISIAWIAHLGGFIVGLAVLPWLMPVYKITIPVFVRQFIGDNIVKRFKK